MQDKTVKIRITQSSFGVEEGQEYYATVEENGFSVCVQAKSCLYLMVKLSWWRIDFR